MVQLKLLCMHYLAPIVTPLSGVMLALSSPCGFHLVEGAQWIISIWILCLQEYDVYDFFFFSLPFF